MLRLIVACLPVALALNAVLAHDALAQRRIQSLQGAITDLSVPVRMTPGDTASMKKFLWTGVFIGGIAGAVSAYQYRDEPGGFFGPMPGMIMRVGSGAIVGGLVGTIVWTIKYKYHGSNQLVRR